MRPRLAEPVVLEQLAEVAVMSLYHLVRTFHRVTNDQLPSNSGSPSALGRG